MAQTLTVKKTESLFDELKRMQARVTSRANEIFHSNGQASGRDIDDWLKAEQELVWRPDIELSEKDDEFRIEIAAPGVPPKALNIEVTPEDILVKADIKHDHKTHEKGEVHICEFASGNLFRGIHLPKPIDTERVTAEFENGMLTIKAPVAVEARVKRIAVGTA